MAGIFDKVVDGINKSVATVGANSKAMMEKAQIKTIIKNLESERKQLAELLGMKVYERYITDTESIEDKSIANFVKEITNRLKEIAVQEAELRRIDEEVNLVTGARMISEGSGVSCTCGHVLSQEAKFCTKCGNALKKNE